MERVSCLKEHRALLHLDARTKFFISLCAFIIVFFARFSYATHITVLIMSLLLSVLGRMKTAIKYFLCFSATVLFLYLSDVYGFFLIIIPPFLLMFLYKLMPIAMAATILMSGPSGELLAALYKLHVPQSVILPFAVAARFAPTISTEIKAIFDAMRVRGVLGSAGKVLLHPLKTFEYILVPMVIRSLKVADELSASAVARGIERRCKRNSYYEMKIGMWDILCMAACCVITILFILN